MMVAAVTMTEMTVADAGSPQATDAMSTALVGLEPDSATMLRSAFESMFAQAEKWCAQARSIQVTSETQKREMKMARESRLALREIRVNAEKARKRLKEDSVRRGKAIDGIANVLKALIEPIEAHLLEQETFAERAEEARRDALRAARTEALIAYGADPNAFVNLGAMAEETWAITIENARAAHEAKIEAAKQAEAIRLEAERIAAEKREAERVAAAKAEAERVERERAQAEENARLKRDAEERDKAAKAEREAAAAERARIEKEAQAAREAAAAEKSRIEAEARAAREAAEAETRKAREEADRVAAELAAAKKAEREREEAEIARRAAEEVARKQAEIAPDRQKLAAFAASIRALTVPTLTTERGQAAGVKIAEQLTKMAAWIEKTGASL